jgi:hypothetical protein
MPWKINIPERYMPSVPWIGLFPTIAIAILAVVLLNAAMDASRVHAVQNVSVPARTTPLQLRTRMGAEQMEVTWDHDSAAIQSADHGTLQIVDGGVTETIPFEAAQLRDGVLIYRQRSNDVSVRMEVNERDGQTISESVRAVARP